jgi:hypothetical protein
VAHHLAILLGRQEDVLVLKLDELHRNALVPNAVFGKLDLEEGKLFLEHLERHIMRAIELTRAVEVKDYLEDARVTVEEEVLGGVRALVQFQKPCVPDVAN